MKARKRVVLVLVGVTVAIITAGVPVVQKYERTADDSQTEVVTRRKCFTEKDVTFLMEVTSSSKERATEVLELACAQAGKSK